MIIQIRIALQPEVHNHPGHLTSGDFSLVSLLLYKHSDLLFEECIHLMMKFFEILIGDFSSRQQSCDTSPILLRKKVRNQTRDMSHHRGLVVKTKNKKEQPSLIRLCAFTL